MQQQPDAGATPAAAPVPPAAAGAAAMPAAAAAAPMPAAAMPAAAAASAAAQQAAVLAAMMPGGAGSAARPALALHPAFAAAMTPGLPPGMLPFSGPAGAFPAGAFAARPGMPSSPFFFPGVPQMAAAAAAGAGAAPSAAPSRRPSSRSSGGRSSSGGKRHCNCKNSRCLKLYCECFASGRYCDACNCLNCHNNRAHESTRQAAVEAILERNPNAFRPKIAGGSEGRHSGGARHNKGCNCKKSGCLKKYCECFQAGIACSDNCKCLDCKNYEGSEAREALLSPQQLAERPPSPMGLRRTSRGSLAAGSPGGAAALAAPGFGSPGAQAPLSLGALQQQPRQLTEEQKQQVAREAMREVMKPEVVEKLAMLLMVVSHEEADRWRQAGGSPAEAAAAAAEGWADGAAAMDVDRWEAQQQQLAGQQEAEQQQQQQQQQQAEQPAAGEQQQGEAGEEQHEGMDVDAPSSGKASPAEAAAGLPNGAAPGVAARADERLPAGRGGGGGGAGESLYEAQERLVLTEFRDTLQMIFRAVGERVEKKVAAAGALLPAGGTPQGLLSLPLPPQGKPGGALPSGGGMLMAAPGGQGQFVLLPPALMAQQAAMLAAGQQLAFMQTPQGLQAVAKPVDPGAGAAAAAAALAAQPIVHQEQQQQQQQQQQEVDAASEAAEQEQE